MIKPKLSKFQKILIKYCWMDDTSSIRFKKDTLIYDTTEFYMKESIVFTCCFKDYKEITHVNCYKFNSIEDKNKQYKQYHDKFFIVSFHTPKNLELFLKALDNENPKEK